MIIQSVMSCLHGLVFLLGLAPPLNPGSVGAPGALIVESTVDSVEVYRRAGSERAWIGVVVLDPPSARGPDGAVQVHADREGCPCPAVVEPLDAETVLVSFRDPAAVRLRAGSYEYWFRVYSDKKPDWMYGGLLRVSWFSREFNRAGRTKP